MDAQCERPNVQMDVCATFEFAAKQISRQLWDASSNVHTCVH